MEASITSVLMFAVIYSYFAISISSTDKTWSIVGGDYTRM